MRLDQILAMRGAMPKSLQMDLSPKALELWRPGVQAEATTDEATISILDVIGQDYWTGEGVTTKRIAGALRSIGAENPVTVYINSPGGDMFEGLAINSLLQEHKGKVTVKVLALAASAASVIAMGADEIQIARGAFFMIHNAWVVAAGNRNELRDVADYLEPFDAAMADIYAQRTGLSVKEVAKAMDGESWIGGSEAVNLGYADTVIDYSAKDDGSSTHASAIRKMDMALAKAGISRNERRILINEFKASTPGAAGAVMSGANSNGTQDAAELDLEFGRANISASFTNLLKLS
jgi:ATP-dependent Clp protease, protease subunit